MYTMKKSSIVLFLIFFAISCTDPDEKFEFTAGDYHMAGTPVYTDLDVDLVPEQFCLEADEELIPAQTESLSRFMTRIWWLADLEPGESREYTIRPGAECSETEYAWQQVDDYSLQLSIDGQPLLQYEHPEFDSDNIQDTNKPFHHLFSPTSDNFISKGIGGENPEQRGLFFGYNQVEIAGRQLDFWHAENGERTEHEEIDVEFTGPVMGGHVARIIWKDREGEQMLEELRDIRAVKQQSDRYYIDFVSRLFATAAPVRLEGDLNSAGVQFRAAQQVADQQESTRFVRPDEWGDYPQDQPLDGDSRVNLPWSAMQFQIDDDTYTVVYMSHPRNPGTKHLAEQMYGRIGEFFSYQQSEGAPTVFRYRLWVIDEESPTVEEIERMYRHYAE